MATRTRNWRRHQAARKQNFRIEQYSYLLRWRDDEPTPQKKGHFRKHNPVDCGQSKCWICQHERRSNKYVNNKDKLSLQERKIQITTEEYYVYLYSRRYHF